MFLARQRIEVSGFDLVDEFYRFAFGGNQVKPAPGHHQARGQAEHAVGNGIAMMVVVEQPRVNIAFAQGRLDGGEVHGQTSIVNNEGEFGRIVRRAGSASKDYRASGFGPRSMGSRRRLSSHLLCPASGTAELPLAG